MRLRGIAFQWASVLAAAVAASFSLGACGGSGAKKTVYLNTPKVESAIQGSILAQRHLRSEVRCPAKVRQEPGEFACVATTVSGKNPHKRIKTHFVVTIHNNRGYVTYIGK